MQGFLKAEVLLGITITYSSVIHEEGVADAYKQLIITCNVRSPEACPRGAVVTQRYSNRKVVSTKPTLAQLMSRNIAKQACPGMYICRYFWIYPRRTVYILLKGQILKLYSTYLFLSNLPRLHLKAPVARLTCNT